MRRNVRPDVRARLAADGGMSLIEATIILLILFLLTAVLSPSVSDYISDARQTKGKEDVEAIGGAIIRLIRDTGMPFPVLDPTADPADLRLAENRVDLLVSDGVPPTAAASTGVAASGGGYVISNALEWDDEDTLTDNIANMNAYLAYNSNAPGAVASLLNPYPVVEFPAAGGPRVGLGWRGAYLSGPIGPDPWGTRYAANTVFLNPSSDSTVSGTNFDVFVLSAGADGVASTPMQGTGLAAGSGTRAVGDDLLYVISGGTR